ncbi:MAG: hypothetical protein QXP80_06870 [Zestosphaera sp.]
MRDKSKGLSGLVEELASTLSKERVDNLKVRASVIADFVKDASKVITTTCDPYESPARYTAIAFSSITDKDVKYVGPEDLMYYIAPYDEGRESKILVYSSSEGLQTLSLLIDQLTWTNHEILIVSQRALSDDLKYRLGVNKVVDLDTQEWLIDTHVVASLAASDVARKDSVRKSRVLSELETIDITVLRELLQSYSGVLEELKAFLGKPFIITASPSMWGVAEELAYGCLVTTHLVQPKAVPKLVERVGRVLLITTDVEEYSLRPVKALAVNRNAEVLSLHLRTDPLTSCIYGLFLIKFLMRL